MKITRNALALAAIAGLAAPALAQDSISNLGTGLPGDSPDAFAAGDQVDKYVVDLVPFTTSWGTEFGLGVLHKSPAVDGPGGFFGSLVSAQAISQNTITANVNDSFDFWQQAGAGVTDRNSAPGSLDLSGDVIQQASLFGSFSGDNNSVSGTVINIDPADSSRLFVTRVLAATNQDASGTGNTAQFGVGSVDAAGNAYFRADDFGTAGNSITGNNLGRVRMLDRAAGAFNQITGPGLVGADAASTDALETGFPDPILTPSNLPAEIFGGSGAVVTTSFAADILFGGASPLSTSPVPPENDFRGSLGMTPKAFSGYGASAATFSSLDKDAAGATNSIRTFAVDSTGAPTSAGTLFTRSSSITDNSNGFVLNAPDSASVHHFSQTAFRGGNGQIDGQVLPSGNLLATATLAVNQASRFEQDPDNFIVAFRETAAGTVEETLVAYTTFSDNKEILDGPGGNAIGTLLPIDVAFGGATGPSMSAPSIDSAGNVWFVAPFQLDAEDFANVGLFRAVYNPANFSYELELVLRANFFDGTTLTGLNSNTPFRLTFTSIADSNSISSGTFWSSNVSADAALDQDPADFDPADPNTLGGAVLSVELSYDVDGDGVHDDPTAGAGDPASVDESYNGLVYIGAITSVVEECPLEFDGQPGLTFGDLNAYVGDFFNNPTNPDLEFDGNTGITFGDLNAYVAAFFAPPASCQ